MCPTWSRACAVVDRTTSSARHRRGESCRRHQGGARRGRRGAKGQIGADRGGAAGREHDRCRTIWSRRSSSIGTGPADRDRGRRPPRRSPSSGAARRAASTQVIAFSIGEHVTAGVIVDGAPWRGAHGLGRRSAGWRSIRSSARTTAASAALEAEVAAAGIVAPLRLAHQVRRSVAASPITSTAISRGSPRPTCCRARGPATASRSPWCATRRSTSAWRSPTWRRCSIRKSSCSAACIASSGDLMLEAIRAGVRRGGCCPRRPIASAIVLSTLGDDAVAIGAARAASRHDRALRRGPRPAGSRRPRRIDRHRPGPHRRDRAARDRRRRRPHGRSIFPTTSSSPASSTCTSTASKASTCSTAATRSPTLRPPAEVRRHGVLSDLGGVRAGDARRRCSTAWRAARSSRAGRRGARPAGAPRKQLHQPGVERRAADALPAHLQAAGQARLKATSPATRSCR